MRVKHGKLKGKGEIFRKQLCALYSGDESEQEGVKKEPCLPSRVKDKNRKSKTKVEDQSRRRKESRLEEGEEKKKKSTEKEKSSKLSRRQNEGRKQDENNVGLESKESKMHQKAAEQNPAIITKNRLTRHIGIYNKSKRSKTILRENLKEKLCSKRFHDVQAETEKDISRVLDCSSFGINSSGGVSVKSPAMQDTPENETGSSIYHHNSSAGSTGKQSYCDTSGKKETTPKNENLEFKTPLQEISENLVQSLNPSDTFRGRKYLTEVQEQLRKLFKQSSVGLKQERHQQSTPEVSSAVHRRCLKRKSEESIKEGSMQHNTNGDTGSKLEERLFPAQEKHEHGIHGENNPPDHETRSDSALGTMNFYTRIPQGKPTDRTATRTAREEKETTNPFPGDSRRIETDPNNQNCLPSTSHGRDLDGCNKEVTPSSSYDILDFLDRVGQHLIGPCNLPELSEFGTPGLLEVSPPKKPTLESPSLQRKFYPRKLY